MEDEREILEDKIYAYISANIPAYYSTHDTHELVNKAMDKLISFACDDIINVVNKQSQDT